MDGWKAGTSKQVTLAKGLPHKREYLTSKPRVSCSGLSSHGGVGVGVGVVLGKHLPRLPPTPATGLESSHSTTTQTQLGKEPQDCLTASRMPSVDKPSF